MDQQRPPVTTRTLTFCDDTIAQAAALIAAGEPVAVPTETVYGLAADATDAAAVARIYAAKGRPSFNPLIVHVPDLAAAEKLAVFDQRARTLAAAFWPGQLTLVLPRRPRAGIASLVTAGLVTNAIRVPAHRAMRALLAAHGADSLGGRIPLIIDDGATEKGLESTIVREVFGTTRILREGPITAEALRGALGGGEEGIVERFDAHVDAPE